MGDRLCYLAPDFHQVFCGDGGVGSLNWYVEGHALACSKEFLCVVQENRALCRRYATSGTVLNEFEVTGSFIDLAIDEGAACGALADGTVACGGWASLASMGDPE